LRLRHGKSGTGGDCLNLDSGSLNCVLDHISMQFSTDENMSSFGSPPENLTLQWSLNAWGLESHSAGGLWDQNHATCNHTRDPKARPSGVLDWINNVTFDYDIGFIMGDSATPASWKANVRNSYFICPPGNIRGYALSRASLDRNGNTNFTLYLNNCRWDRDGDTLLDGTNAGYGMVTGNYATATAPIPNPGSAPVTMDDPTVAWKKLVSSSGALRTDVGYTGPLRDEVDTRLIQNLVSQTRNHITRESDLVGVSGSGFGTLNSSAAPLDTDKDGMPDYYEQALGWNAAVADHNTALPSSGGVITGTTFLPPGSLAGYTRLEEYLHFLCLPHGTVPKNIVGVPSSLTVDLGKFTSGFSSSPVFVASNIVGGSVTVAGAVATFTPTLNFSGRGKFDFTVSDAAGHSWTQTCGILISAAALPRDLAWRGSGATWDGVSQHWLLRPQGTPAAFSLGDRVAFTAAGSAQPNVTVTGTVSPGSVDVDSTTNYTFGGAGAISSAGELSKRGTGILTVNNTGGNQFGRVRLAEGTLALGNSTALGTAPIVLEGGIWDIGGNAPTANGITVDGAATIRGGSGSGGTGIGSISGSAPLTISQTSVFDLRGDMAGYSGRLTATGNSQIRFNGTTGSALATFDLGAGATSLAKRTTVGTIMLGGLAGGSNTILQGATGNTSATTYLIGDNGANTTFAGRINNGGGTTSITKNGGGVLTLAGTSSYTGATDVTAGELIVNGELGNTAVTIRNTAKLRGAGTIGGTVRAEGGSQISPGIATGTTGTLGVGPGLTLDGATLSLQLSQSPTGANDKVILTGGVLALAGMTNLVIGLNDGALGAGVYELITGGVSTTGGVENLFYTPPANDRQLFVLTNPPGKLLLTVTNEPGTLRWLGTSTTWDGTAANWANTISGVSPDTFRTGDAVVFDDTAASGTVTVAQAVAPRSVAVTNSTRAYSISGSSITSTGALTKNGSATLTLHAANWFAGGVRIHAGTVALGSAAANADALDGGAITLNGGTLRMYSAGDATSAGTFPGNLFVPTTGTLQTAPRGVFSGSVTGSGILNYYTTYVRADITGDWSDFFGTVNVTTDAGGGDYRITSNYSWPGLPNATVNLNSNIWFYFAGISNTGAGTTISIGELTGASGSHLRGGVTGGRALNYRIGGKTPAGGTAVFNGVIEEQNTATLTNIAKTGAGRWVIRDGDWNGGTAVESGILEVTGTVNCASATEVAEAAQLILTGGTLGTDVVNLANGAVLQTSGTSRIDGELSTRGTVTVLGGKLTVTGDLVNTGTPEVRSGGELLASGEVVNDGTMRFLAGTKLTSGAVFTNNGVLDLLTSEGALPANFTNQGTVILNTARRILTFFKTGSTFTCTVQGYTGHSYQLQRSDTLSGTWTSLGVAQAGTGGILTFTHPAAAPGRGFYRVQVTP
jgi:autotransporter-associated beta strand protein